MEPSKILGESEECRSNESGWTTYIGSSIDGADDQNEQNDDNDNKSDVNHEGYSDDSMTSDASSGPIHQGNQWGNVEGGYYCGFDDFKHDEHELYESKAEKRDEKTKEKQKNVTRIENEEMIFRQKKSKSSVQIHGDKVRTSLCLGSKK